MRSQYQRPKRRFLPGGLMTPHDAMLDPACVTIARFSLPKATEAAEVCYFVQLDALMHPEPVTRLP